MEDRPGEGAKLTLKRQQQPWNISNAVRERDITRDLPPGYAELRETCRMAPCYPMTKSLLNVSSWSSCVLERLEDVLASEETSID